MVAYCYEVAKLQNPANRAPFKVKYICFMFQIELVTQRGVIYVIISKTLIYVGNSDDIT